MKGVKNGNCRLLEDYWIGNLVRLLEDYCIGHLI